MIDQYVVVFGGTGPEAVSFPDAANKFSKILGKDVKHIASNPDTNSETAITMYNGKKRKAPQTKGPI